MGSIPVTEKRKAELEALARQQGRDLAALTDDVLAGGMEYSAEEQQVRQMLNERYDEAFNGTTQLFDPQDARRELTHRHSLKRKH